MVRVLKVRAVLEKDGTLQGIVGMIVETEGGNRSTLLGEDAPGALWLPADEVLID